MSNMSTTTTYPTDQITDSSATQLSVTCEKVPQGKLKVLVITGASDGIGLAIARHFIATKKWVVYSLSRKVKKDPKIYYLACDITNIQVIQSTFAQIYQEQGRVDLIINNSGYGLAGNFEALSSKNIVQQFNVNLFGIINVNQIGLIYLNQKHGQIINIGSILSKYTLPYMTAYSASKWAVVAYTKSLAQQLRDSGSKIKINIILPGPVKSDFQKNKHVFYSTNPKNSAKAKEVLQTIEANSLKHGLTPEKVAQFIFGVVGSKKLIHVPGLKIKFLVWLSNLLNNDQRRQKLIHWLYKLG